MARGDGADDGDGATLKSKAKHDESSRAVLLEDRLVGKVASVFTSTGTQHGGQESTILSTQIVLLHLGMILVGLPYSFKGQIRVDEITGGSPYGASTIAGAD